MKLVSTKPAPQIIGILMLVLMTFPAYGQFSFEEPREIFSNYSTKPYAYSRWMESTDLDGDGDLDLVYTTESDLILLRNSGDGPVSEPELISSDLHGPTKVVLVDLDNDNDQDIVVSLAEDSMVVWFKNDGQGSFGSKIIISDDVPYVNDINILDLDADGSLDVLYILWRDDIVGWFKNNGASKFSQAKIITNEAFGGSGVIGADLDNDGDIDVLSASYYDNKVAWYENLGGGNFGTQQIIHSRAENTTNVYAADLDSDGDLDVFSVGSDFFWYQNEGNGSFSDPIWVQINTPGGKQKARIFISDYNGDNNQDLLISGGNFEIVLNPSRDTNNRVTIDHRAINDITSVDYTQNGFEDLLVNNYGEITLYKNINGEFEPGEIITPSVLLVEDIKVADLNGDGYQDIISLSSWDGKIAWYPNRCGGSIGDQIVVARNESGIKAIAIADLNGDGMQDIVKSDATNNKLSWYLNFENGASFGKEIVLSNSLIAIDQVYTGDLNGDGYVDIITASSTSGKLSWHSNDGLGNFGVQILTGAFKANELALNDIENDGDLDIVGISDTEVILFENTGLGQFNERVLTASLTNPGELVILDDVTDDDFADIIITTEKYNEYGEDHDHMYAFYNNGAGGFGQAELIKDLGYAGFGIRSMLFADIDNDHFPDIVSASHTSSKNRVAIQQNNGDGFNSFSSLENGRTYHIQSINALDIDLDGDLDIISGYKRKILLHENQLKSQHGQFPPLWCTVSDNIGGFSNNKPQFTLAPSFPNPSSGETEIIYHLFKPNEISLVVYDLLGRLVSTLVNEYQEAGRQSIKFNTSELAPGTYIYRLASGGQSDTKLISVIH